MRGQIQVVSPARGMPCCHRKMHHAHVVHEVEPLAAGPHRAQVVAEKTVALRVVPVGGAIAPVADVVGSVLQRGSDILAFRGEPTQPVEEDDVVLRAVVHLLARK